MGKDLKRGHGADSGRLPLLPSRKENLIVIKIAIVTYYGVGVLVRMRNCIGRVLMWDRLRNPGTESLKLESQHCIREEHIHL